MDNFPKKIVCTVPSITEYLIDLGLEEVLVGVTKFCIHPKSKTKSIQKIGGTKTLKIKDIQELNPDLIICNKEENDKEQIESLSKNLNVYVSEIKNYESAIDALYQIGIITNKEEEAKGIISIIEQKKTDYTVEPSKYLKACYLIWKDPYMTVGGDTYIHSMMEMAGFTNIFQNRQRYPTISLAQIKSMDPDVLLLSSEPFPFSEKHIKEIQEVIECDIMLVDGELFSWYGSRMIFAFKYFDDLIQELHS